MHDELRELYNSLYDEMELEKYKKLEKRAYLKMDTFTSGRAESFMSGHDEEKATDFERTVYRAIKYTLCELICKMSLLEASEGNITSVSNKGYSESYKVYTEAERQDELNTIMRIGLSGTGLAGAL